MVQSYPAYLTLIILVHYLSQIWSSFLGQILKKRSRSFVIPVLNLILFGSRISYSYLSLKHQNSQDFLYQLPSARIIALDTFYSR